MTVDQKCVELAQHFLQDELSYNAADAMALAIAIQRAVEEWLEDFRRDISGSAS